MGAYQNIEDALPEDLPLLAEAPPYPPKILTAEQLAILGSTGDIRINAVAGSGKTTTIIEYAKTRPRGARILYLAFNRSVRLEAERKFAAHGLHQVQVDTAHSLAYRQVVRGGGYRVRAQGYKLHELPGLLGLRGHGEKHIEFIIANHISRFLSYFCNSDKQKVQDLNYLDVVSDPQARGFSGDFIREARLKQLKEECSEEPERHKARWNEEINLLYVAITRARRTVRIPESLLPRDHPASKQIVVLKTKKEEDSRPSAPEVPIPQSIDPRTYWKERAWQKNAGEASFAGVRKDYKEAYRPWTPESDAELRRLYEQGTRLPEIARHFHRTPGAISARLRKLEG